MDCVCGGAFGGALARIVLSPIVWVCVCLRARAFAFYWPCLFLFLTGLYMYPYFLFHFIRMLETYIDFHVISFYFSSYLSVSPSYPRVDKTFPRAFDAGACC